MLIIRKFYSDNPKSHSIVGGKPLLHPIINQVVGGRSTKEELHRICLPLLSLGEMSLRQSIAVTDIDALIAFVETSQNMGCIKDVLHMVIHAVSRKQLFVSFLEQIKLIEGFHLFVNFLERLAVTCSKYQRGKGLCPYRDMSPLDCSPHSF